MWLYRATGLPLRKIPHISIPRPRGSLLLHRKQAPSLAAKNLDRNSVGYEINPKFMDTIKRKLEVDTIKNGSTVKVPGILFASSGIVSISNM